MADSSKLLMLGGAAAAVWYFYFRNPAPAAVAHPINTGGVSVPPVTTGAAPAPAASAPDAHSIAAIEARVLAASGNPSDGLGPDAWGWYLNNELAAIGKPAAPDPLSVFGMNLDRSQKMTAAQYWPPMEAALRAQYGLSGLRGLGLYGLGAWGRAN